MYEYFGHEKLRVYSEALKFIEWIEENTKTIPKTIAAKKHLDEASTSVVLNIAEGNGRYTNKDKCRFFDISKGSALECAGCIDILKRKGYDIDDISGKIILKNIFSMLIGLIKATSENRVFEDLAKYQ